MTFRETAGGAGRITETRVTVEATRPHGRSAAGTVQQSNLPFQGSGTVSAFYAQRFEAPPDVTTAVWRLSASGVDVHGRSFQVAQVEWRVALPD